MRNAGRRTTLSALALCMTALALARPGETRAAAAGGPLAVSVSLAPAEVRVGDTARLTVTVDHPGGGSLAMPELDRGKAVVALERKRETAALKGGPEGAGERTTVAVLLTSFEVGEHRVGPGKVAFTDGSGLTLETDFPETLLRTKSVLRGENTPMRGIKGPARWPAPIGRWAALAAALLLTAGAAVLVARRRKAAPPKPVSGPRAALPHETALRALAALRSGMPAEPGGIEPFYRELSSVVRGYLEGRFGLRAPERTTEEFIREAAGSGALSPAHQVLVRAFLEQCDLVKFARHLPPPADLASALGAAERLVRETRQAAAP